MTITNRCAVLGRPIAHSLSPVLHNAAYRSLGLDDWDYGRHDVGEDDLDAFLKSLDPSWRGLSLTMPLKKTIQPYGTPSNVWAKTLGVANTAVFDWADADHTDPAWPNGRPGIRLYNTDVAGIQLAFDHAEREHGVHRDATAQGHALIIGNGNTAVSAAAACLMMPGAGRITVASRHPGRDLGLDEAARLFRGDGDGRHERPYGEIDLNDARGVTRAAVEADVVINTIPGHAADGLAGMLDDSGARLHGMLLDVVYDPRPTRLMQVWRSHGGQAVGGEEMLLYQGLIQVLLMTGIWDGDPPSDADRRLQDVTADDDHLEIDMRRALEAAL